MPFQNLLKKTKVYGVDVGAWLFMKKDLGKIDPLKRIGKIKRLFA